MKNIPLFFRSRRIFAAPVWPVAGTSGNAGVTIAKKKRHSNVPDSPLYLGYNRSAMLNAYNIEFKDSSSGSSSGPGSGNSIWGSFGSSVGNPPASAQAVPDHVILRPFPTFSHRRQPLGNNIDLPLAFAKDRQPDVVSVRRNQITRLQPIRYSKSLPDPPQNPPLRYWQVRRPNRSGNSQNDTRESLSGTHA